MFKDEDVRVPPFYATQATKGLVPLVYENILKFSEEAPFNEADIAGTLQHLRLPEQDGSIDWFRRELGKLRFHSTSHLPGSAMVELNIQGRTVLHTGDLRVRESPTLPATKIPELTPDLLVVDGTYAGANPGRDLRDWEDTRQDLFALLDTILERRSVLLLPSFALGRSQDVLALVLEHAESRQNANYYVYLDGQSSRVTQSIYPRFRHELSPHYVDLVARNDWRIKPVNHDIALTRLIDTEIAGYPSVVIASSGMLLADSASRQWAEALMANSQNIVAFTGYVTEDIREEVFDRGLLGSKQWARRPSQLGCSSHASLGEIESLSRQLDARNVAIVHCGSGDLQGPGSLFARLKDQGQSVIIGREEQQITISDKGARIDDN
jgi:Cft2 family RNA processing exonuclease